MVEDIKSTIPFEKLSGIISLTAIVHNNKLLIIVIVRN